MNFPLLQSFQGSLDLTKSTVPTALIREIQFILIQAGFNLIVDGEFGTKTLTAFRTFKRKAYLQQENILGESTVEALLEIIGDVKHPDVFDKEPVKLSGLTFKLPTGLIVDVADYIQGSRNFTWGEATANATRKPQSISIENNIIKTALYLERIRDYFSDRSITITSWYRPPDVNKRVGGVSNSTHLLGHGVDFKVADIQPLEVYQRLDGWHGHNGGLGKSSAFTHLDLRGYSARWRYGR